MKAAGLLLLGAVFLLASCTGLFPAFAADRTLPQIDDDLPAVYIRTDSGKNPGRDDNSVYFAGSMRITLNDCFAGCKNDYTTDQMQPVGIRTRGNSTRTFAGAVGTGKYSYRLKLDKKADLFGMGASKNWALLANVYDQTNVRNALAGKLAKALGIACCDSTWVVLYLNGQNRGLYLLCETVGVGKNRLDITDWDDIAKDVASAVSKREGLSAEKADALADAMEADLSWVTSGQFEGYNVRDCFSAEPDITGGYLIEYDSFDNPHDDRPFLFEGGTTPAGVKLKIDTPEKAYTNRDMLEYVRKLILDFEEAVTSPRFCTSDGRHYSELCDMESLVDFYLVNEVFMNGEFGIRSMFFYIEDGKIHWGPVWDFDCAAGNAITVTTGYEGQIGTDEGRNQWFKALYNDSYFTTLVQNRFANIRETLYALPESAEIYRDYIAAEARRDYEMYGPRCFNLPEVTLGTFDEEYDFYLNWQKNRIKWLEQTLLGGTNPVMGAMEYSDKTNVQIRYSGSGDPLPPDTLTLYGAKSDFIYDPRTDESIDVTFTTTHTTASAADLFLNGKLYKRIRFLNGKPTKITLSASDLCMEDGARNSLHLVISDINGAAYRRYGFTVLVHDGRLPDENQAVVQIRDSFIVANKGEKQTLPDAPDAPEGFAFAGWTDGKNVYEPQSSITVTKNLSLYAKWTHTGGMAVLYAGRTPILYGNARLAPNEPDAPAVPDPPAYTDTAASPGTPEKPNTTAPDTPANPGGDGKSGGGKPGKVWAIVLSIACAAAAIGGPAAVIAHKRKKK